MSFFTQPLLRIPTFQSPTRQSLAHTEEDSAEGKSREQQRQDRLRGRAGQWDNFSLALTIPDLPAALFKAKQPSVAQPTTTTTATKRSRDEPQPVRQEAEIAQTKASARKQAPFGPKSSKALPKAGPPRRPLKFVQLSSPPCIHSPSIAATLPSPHSQILETSPPTVQMKKRKNHKDPVVLASTSLNSNMGLKRSKAAAQPPKKMSGIATQMKSDPVDPEVVKVLVGTKSARLPKEKKRKRKRSDDDQESTVAVATQKKKVLRKNDDLDDVDELDMLDQFVVAKKPKTTVSKTINQGHEVAVRSAVVVNATALDQAPTLGDVKKMKRKIPDESSELEEEVATEVSLKRIKVAKSKREMGRPITEPEKLAEVQQKRRVEGKVTDVSEVKVDRGGSVAKGRTKMAARKLGVKVQGVVANLIHSNESTSKEVKRKNRKASRKEEVDADGEVEELEEVVIKLKGDKSTVKKRKL